VYYSDPKRQNFRIPITGGSPEPLLAELTAGGRPLPPAFHEPVPSPDGRAVAGHYQDSGQERRTRRGAIDRFRRRPSGGFPDVRANARWAPDGKSLIFHDRVNLFRQPVAGGPATQITRFPGDTIFSFALSNDQKQFAFVRGQIVSDVVLVTTKK
jgi:Tol biopolymer transport system component